MSERNYVRQGRKPKADPYREYVEVLDGNAVRSVAAEEVPERSADGEKSRKLSETTIRNRERALSLDIRSVAFLTAAVTVCVLVCINFLEIRSESTKLQEEVIRLETRVASQEMENDIRQSQITSSVNLVEVKRRAEEMGMTTPSEGQIVYYESADRDYVRQYQELPENILRG